MADKKRRGQLVSWQEFQGELQQREKEIASMLPNNVSKARFLNTAIAAVKQTPALLNATPRTLFASITKAAQDGLLPDGREGVINVYREKQPDNSYENVASWNPMTHGLRKRARELDDIIVNAQVVYSADTFEWLEGDEPKIVHKPAALTEERGEMLGAYAIFKDENGAILHREVMSGKQINAVKEQSKAKTGLMWTKFPEEAWRKTVIRRGFKTVPVSEKLEQIVQRDDDEFDFEASAGAVIEATATTIDDKRDTKAKPEIVQPPKEGEKRELPPRVGQQAQPGQGPTQAQEPTNETPTPTAEEERQAEPETAKEEEGPSGAQLDELMPKHSPDYFFLMETELKNAAPDDKQDVHDTFVSSILGWQESEEMTDEAVQIVLTAWNKVAEKEGIKLATA